jgi:hypothetical protein
MLNVDRRWDVSDPIASIFAGLRGVEGDIALPVLRLRSAPTVLGNATRT